MNRLFQSLQNSSTSTSKYSKTNLLALFLITKYCMCLLSTIQHYGHHTAYFVYTMYTHLSYFAMYSWPEKHDILFVNSTVFFFLLRNVNPGTWAKSDTHLHGKGHLICIINMAIQVMEFQVGVYKISKVFA